MISIAMATYNGEKYLRKQLDSILAQTITDWELVVCDDCSKDSTVEILKSYQRKDNRIKVFINKKNLGFKKNFESAIGLCSGEYIGLCDQDDIWHENHLEVLLGLIGDASLSCGNAKLMTANSVITEKKLSDVEKLSCLPNDTHKLLYRLLLISNPFQGASMLIRKEFLSKILPIPDGVLYHDAWIAACACMKNGIAYTFEPITDYRQHENNVTVAARRLEKHSIVRKIKNGYKVFFQGKILYSDRFCYIKELEQRYGLENVDFKRIRRVYNHMETSRLSPFDIFFLLKNWFYISTSKTYKGFFSFILRLPYLRPYNE